MCRKAVRRGREQNEKACGKGFFSLLNWPRPLFLHAESGYNRGMTHALSAPLPRLSDGVTRLTLPNGLRVLIKENHTAPVVSLHAQVKVGYFQEPDWWNGIAHVVEHMLFKGTPARPGREQAATEVREMGGSINAATYYEETFYYLTVPSNTLEKAMDLHADMVRHPLFDAEELAREIEVIVQESQQKRDNPTSMLIESLYELAHDAHRIRRWRIGLPETLRGFRRSDLVEFTREAYTPSNTILTLVGDVTAETAQALAERFWGNWSGEPYTPAPAPAEEKSAGFRARRVLGNTTQRLFALHFPAPPELSPDSAALMILSAALSDGRSSRLTKKLKEEQSLATSAWASYEGFADLGVFLAGGESRDEDPLPLQQALWKELATLKTDLLAEEELTRLKRRISARRLSAQEEVSGMARTLASCEALGDYHLADTLADELARVTSEGVREAAANYFDLSRASLLEYLPKENTAPERTSDELFGLLTQAETAPRPPSEPPLPVLIPLSGGGSLVYKHRDDLPLVAVSVLFRGGRYHETAETGGLTNLMVRASLKGTRRLTAEQIAEKVEGAGSGIGTSLSPDYFGYGFKCTTDALTEVFDTLLEVVHHPLFPPEEVEKERIALLADIRRQQDSNFSVAYDLFSAACFGAHPYGLPSLGDEGVIAGFTPQALAEWRTEQLRQDNLVVSIVGAVSEKTAEEMARKLASGLSIGEEKAAVPFAFAPSDRRETTKEKQQSALVLGFPGARVDEDRRHALDVLAEVVAGMGGRFFRVVRGENSLAYQVTGFHRSRKDAGIFAAYTSTAPENLDFARDLLLQECQKLTEEPISEEELQQAVAILTGEHAIGTQTFAAQAGELAGCALYHLPLDASERYLARIAQLTPPEIQKAAADYLQPELLWMGTVRGGQTESGQ